MTARRISPMPMKEPAESRDRAVAPPDLLGEIAGDEEVHYDVRHNHEQNAERGVECGEYECGLVNHVRSPIVCESFAKAGD